MESRQSSKVVDEDCSGTEIPTSQMEKVEILTCYGSFGMPNQVVVGINRTLGDAGKCTDVPPAGEMTGMKLPVCQPGQLSPSSVAASSDDSGILSEHHEETPDPPETVLPSVDGQNIAYKGVDIDETFPKLPAVDGKLLEEENHQTLPSIYQTSSSLYGPSQTIEIVPDFGCAAEIGVENEMLSASMGDGIKEEPDSSTLNTSSNNTVVGTVSFVSDHTGHVTGDGSVALLPSSALQADIHNDVPIQTVSIGQVYIKDEPLDSESNTTIKEEPESESAPTKEKKAPNSIKPSQLAIGSVSSLNSILQAKQTFDNNIEYQDKSLTIPLLNRKVSGQHFDVREIEKTKRLVVVVEDFLKIRLPALNKAKGKRTKSHIAPELTKRNHKALQTKYTKICDKKSHSKTQRKFGSSSKTQQKLSHNSVGEESTKISSPGKIATKKQRPMLPNQMMGVDKNLVSVSLKHSPETVTKESPVKSFVEKVKLRQSNQYDSRRKFILPPDAKIEKITMNHPGNTRDFVENLKHKKEEKIISKYKALNDENKEIVKQVLHNPKNERFRNSVINFKKGIFLCQLCNKRFHNRKGYVSHQREHVRSIDIYQPYITKGTGPIEKLNAQESGDSQDLDDDDTSDSEYGDRYICQICGKTLHSKRSFSHHKTIHKRIDPTDLPRCKLCGTFFTKMTSVHHHLRNAHYVCWQCGKKCNDAKDLNLHRKNSHSALCEICGQSCDSPKALTQHAAHHFLAKGPEKFKTKYQIQKEAREKMVDSNRIKDGENSNESEEEEGEELEYEEKSSIEQTDLKASKGKTHERPYICQCGRQLKTWDSFQAHSMIHRGLKPYSCPICNKGFLSSSSRVTHVRHCHSDDRPYKCTYCEASFKSTSAKDVHIRLHHTKEKPHKCEECGKMFSLSSSLKSHKQAWHSVKAEYECKVCHREFKLPGTLSIHMRQHTGEKPYVCKQCGKAFRQGSHLRTHVRTHSNERLYPCQICNKAFTQSSHLNTHMKIHLDKKDHKCEYCGKGFNLSSTLKTHLRVHTGEKPFECRICGKTFNQSSARKSHERCHSDEKPLECEICGNRFKLKGTLKTHMLVHSKELPHKCTYCEKEFTTGSSLKVHINSKHELKLKYSCTKCDKKFVARHLLDRHQETHEKSKISCSTCGKILKNRYTLQSHMKKCH